MLITVRISRVVVLPYAISAHLFIMILVKINEVTKC